MNPQRVKAKLPPLSLIAKPELNFKYASKSTQTNEKESSTPTTERHSETQHLVFHTEEKPGPQQAESSDHARDHQHTS